MRRRGHGADASRSAQANNGHGNSGHAYTDRADLGATAQLRAEVRDQNGQTVSGAAVAWTSSNAQVATVDATGLVTAVTNGATSITARSGTVSDTAAVTVAQEVGTVTVSPPADSLLEADTLRLSAEATDANGHAVAGAEFSWASSDTRVARVDDSGLVTGVAVGAAEISATSSGVTGRAEITVVAPVPTTVSVTPDTVVFTALGQTEQIAAEVRDQIGQTVSGAAVAWTSSNAQVATVDATGLVTAVTNGATSITARSGTVSDTAAVTVAQEVGTVTVSPPADSLLEADTLRLSAEATDANGHAVAGAEFSWASSDTRVARVDDSGLVTGVAVGAAEISATSSGVTGRAEITVVAPVPTTVSVTPDTVVFTALGQTEQIAAEVRDQIGRVMVGVAVSWSSSDTLVATVDAGGLVTAVGSGATSIAARSGTVSGTAAVTVAQEVGTVTVSPPADSLLEADTLRLSAEATDANGHAVAGAEFSWASSDTRVARVDDSGLVTGVAVGAAEISATSSGVTGRAEITVVAPVPTTVSVTPDTVVFTALGQTEQIAAEVRDQIGRVMVGVAVSWSSSDTLVATVDAGGLVTAVGSGATSIAARSGTVSGTAAVTVAQEVGTVTVSPPADSLLEADTLRLSAEATDANGHAVAGAEFSWASSDTRVARVDDSGLVTGVAVGAAEISATSSGVTGRAEITVVAPVPTTVSVTPDTVVFTALGQTEQIAAEVRDQIGRVMVGVAVSWSSSDTLVATVDAGGLVTAVGSGSAIVSAAAGEVSGSAVITVTQSAGTITVSPLADTIAPGDTLRLVAKALDENGHPVEGTVFAWSSSDVSIARVDRSGLVRGVAEGVATITAVAGRARGTAEITIQNPDRGVLVALYEATDGPNWVDNEGWLTDAPLGEWYGVEADGFGRVVGLNLQGRWDSERREWIPHGLQGSIPAEIGSLTALSYLRLNNNALTGDIPPELGSLVNLRSLNLGSNALTGSIPTVLGSLSNLDNLQLYGNEITGGIPTQLGSLTALRHLSLGENELAGLIPTELGNLSNLVGLYLGNNTLTGPIPTELGSLTALRSLSLGGNELTGTVPAELGNLPNLETLSLGWNQLTGPLPRSLLQLANLTWLYFLSTDGLCAPGTAEFAAWLEGIKWSHGPFCNQADREALELLFESAGGSGWTGSDGWLATQALEEWHGVTADSLGRVETLDLTRNGLEGELSPAIGNLDRMTRLRIGANELSGRLPLSLAKLSLVEFHYDDTELCAPTEESFREWLSAIPSREGTGLECLSVRGILKSLYEATDGPNWVDNEGWLTDAPLGEWYGVEADGFGRVVGLNLQGRWDSERREWIPHGLQGSIPAEIGSLTALSYLRLNNNALTGDIPPELGDLVNLENLQLYSNALTGPIPTELRSLTALRSLSLGGNELTGPVPTELGNLTNLENLQLYSNALTGPIPTELASLTDLRALSLARNELTGPIPTELGNLTNLENLQVHSNALTGPIPTVLGSLTALRSLSLGGNELTGPVPTELGNLTNLENLQLYSNALTGPIPTELGSLTALRSLSLEWNELAGPIPTELGNLSNLENLSLGSNALTGPIPRSLLQLVNLRWLFFPRNDGLCAPGTAEFAAWIEGIESLEGPFCNQADREALELLFETAGGSGWARSDGWLATQALEEWHGAAADALGRVTALDLSGNGLSGRVPNWGWGALAHITELRIGGNADLAGRLPLSLAGLSLRALHYEGTGVCAPADAAFARWLNAIPSHEGTGVECAPLSDREILEVLYDVTGGPDWTNNENWLTDHPLAEWHGVEVDNGERVAELELFANRLRGTIPPELGKLTELRRLVFARNRGGLRGPIPAELGNLPNLEELYLYSNALEGPIPPELGGLQTLETLSLLSNDLEGAIPPELGNLANLRGLYLHDNDLEGAIPPELGNLAKLQHLFLAGNRLTGSIPSTLRTLASLRALSLVRNDLTGSLPTELGGLGALERLYVGHNALTGPVPQEFGGLTGLRELALSGNIDMSGALPSSLTNLRSLETLEASGTQLCAPSDPRFLEWLDQLPSPRVALCGHEPAAAYLVQPVQSRVLPVPLVAGEEALLRVFITAARNNEERLPPVRASFHLDGALVHVADIPGKPGPIPTDVDEGSLAGSANGVIPGDVVRPGLEMVIEIDPDGTLDAGLGVAKRIPETGRMPVDVREMPFFSLTVIPFLWTTDPDLAILEQTEGMAADPESHELLDLTRILLPVGELDVDAHQPVHISSNDAYAIHGKTWMIRAMEGGTGYYMGMMSGPVTGAGGLGSLGRPVSFSVPGNGVIAHELGHNMSLSHAPCGGAPGPDQAFPYSDGVTGAWGYDFREGGRVLGPEEKDLMGYCVPWWISDYHFTKALNFRLDDEEDAGADPVAEAATSLLLWGGVDSTGTPFLEPAFVVDARPSLPASGGEYAVTGHTASGGELFSLRFTMPEEADGDGSSSFAFVLPVRPGWQGNLGSITLTGPGGTFTLDRQSNQPMTILRDPRTGQVRAILRDVPGPNGAQADAEGALGVGRGLETLFSRGIPDSAAWRR